MPSSISWTLLLLACLCFPVPGSLVESPQEDAPVQETDVSKNDQSQHQPAVSHDIAPNLADFALKFYSEVAHKHNTTNIFYSPMSIAMAFALLSMGASSDTYTQILEALQFNLTDASEAEMHEGFQHLLHTIKQPDSQLQLTIGNGLFIDENLKLVGKFLEDAKKLYDSEAFSVNFKDTEAVKKQINDYVEKETQGKIVDLIKELDKDTVLALVNCIYFQGKWKNPFNVNHTYDRDFHVDEKTTIKVPMMTRTGFFNLHREDNLFSWVLRMDYEGNATALFLMPDVGKMQHLEDGITKELLYKWLGTNEQMFAEVLVPRLSISATYELYEVLSNLGMIKAFRPEADFSRLSEEASLMVSKAVHKAVLTIDEKGTEAAGSTVIQIMPVSLPPMVEFKNPFLVLIYHRDTNSPLFIGRVVNPSQL